MCSFEQDTLRGNFLYYTQDSDDGSIQVKTTFKVHDAKRVKETSDGGIPNSELFVEVIERVEIPFPPRWSKKCGPNVEQIAASFVCRIAPRYSDAV